ncbi:MAG: hypothetical protein KIT36_10595 [Alphaproteobacteria bacterium]|nr:hypothetical protein [Alphaproteobacteria bacterium]
MGDETLPAIGLDPQLARAIVDDAARRYFDSRRARVKPFVDRHFSVTGAAAIHRKALGWDLARAPANLLLAGPHLAVRLAASWAGSLGSPRAAEFLKSRRLMFDTDVAREVEWLIMTEFLELPFRQGGRRSDKDALSELILADRRLAAVLDEALTAIGRRAGDGDFRRRLEEVLATYGGTRAASADIATSLLSLATGALALKQATPGVVSLGPALAAVIAHNAAVASFPLGAWAGGIWYGMFPVAATPALVAAVTGGLLVVAAMAGAFAGMVTDPLQRRLGLHRRRLIRLVAALEDGFLRDGGTGFVARDQYVARLLDLVDMIGSAWRLTRL